MEGILINDIVAQSWLWSDKPFSNGMAYIDLGILASKQARRFLTKGELVNLDKNQTLASENYLAVRWGWSRKKVRYFLQKLEEEGSIERKTSHLGTFIIPLKFIEIGVMDRDVTNQFTMHNRHEIENEVT